MGSVSPCGLCPVCGQFKRLQGLLRAVAFFFSFKGLIKGCFGASMVYLLVKGLKACYEGLFIIYRVCAYCIINVYLFWCICQVQGVINGRIVKP